MIHFPRVVESDENLEPPASGPSPFASSSACATSTGKAALGSKRSSCPRQFRDGHLLSILAMIRSAIVIASATADSNAGDGRPSQFASLRAARMLAAIRSTRLRPSSTMAV